MFGDGFFVHGVLDLASKLSSPVYFYLFDYQNSFSFNRLFGNCQKPLGVTHADDLNLLFDMSGFIKYNLNEQETEVSKTMINIWSQFASTKYIDTLHDLIKENLKLKLIFLYFCFFSILTINGQSNGEPWPIFTTSKDSLILHLDSPVPKIKKNPFVDTYQFWQELPLLSRLGIIPSTKGSHNKVKTEL